MLTRRKRRELLSAVNQKVTFSRFRVQTVWRRDVNINNTVRVNLTAGFIFNPNSNFWQGTTISDQDRLVNNTRRAHHITRKDNRFANCFNKLPVFIANLDVKFIIAFTQIHTAPPRYRCQAQLIRITRHNMAVINLLAIYAGRDFIRWPVRDTKVKRGMRR